MILSILLIIVCGLLILVVLMQNSKGGGISSQFSAANQIMGVRRGADVSEKATWTLAVALLSLSLISAAYNKPTEGQQTGKDNQSVTKNHEAGDNTGGSTTTPLKTTTPPANPNVPLNPGTGKK